MRDYSMIMILAICLLLCSCCRQSVTWEDTCLDRNGLLHLREKESPFTGVVVSKYANGRVKATTPYRQGVIHGISCSWHEDGSKASETSYHDGVRVGGWTKWYPNGRVQEDIRMRDGMVFSTANYYSTGELCIYCEYDWIMKTMSQTVYDKANNVLACGTIGQIDGEKRTNGTFCCTEYGMLLIENYSNGTLVMTRDLHGNRVEMKDVVRDADAPCFTRDVVDFIEQVLEGR
jgi:antitoxin component YwqK of YwqJK toxin-antitoxin module